MPLQASAGFLSSVMGKEASANTEAFLAIEIPKNSQTIAILQANPAILPISKDKKADFDQFDVTNIASSNALVPSASPMSSIPAIGGVSDSDPVDQVSVYVVRAGDTISQIADMFEVTPNTIIWANDLKKGQKLTAGQVLVILPVSGVKHTVAKGQTLKSLAKTYKVEVDDIASFNGLSDDARLAVGDELIIPDGVLSTSAPATPSKSSAGSSSGSVGPYLGTGPMVSNPDGYFINPVPGLTRRSQGLHGNGNRGVDLAAPIGTPIYASASGTVLLARNGYNGGYGNMVIIQHPNGTKTLYAHMSKLGTSGGAQVSQGELIGYVGSTGRSTGPHLHFEVFNAKNPGGDWSWKN